MNETIPLPTRFADRAAMLAHVAALSGRDDAASAVPDIATGGRKAAEAVLAKVDPRAYAAELPADIAAGETGVACVDQFIATLVETGYLHNHARMYLASYTVHWRRVSWQAGARFFLEHLVDADPASNNLSWQWIASTFSNKPYIFNLENVAKYCGPDINTIPRHNLVLDKSYERLSELLFPYMGGPHG